MGVIHKERGELEHAITCYERALAAAPNFGIVQVGSVGCGVGVHLPPLPALPNLTLLPSHLPSPL